MDDKPMIKVEVAFALPERQQIVPVTVEAGCSVREAVRRSGIARLFPEVDVESAKLGIFGKAVGKPEQEAVADGDRVEIYRPLIADPKEVRKQRARKGKTGAGDD